MFQFQRLRPHVLSVMRSEHDHLEICVVVYSIILPVNKLLHHYLGRHGFLYYLHVGHGHKKTNCFACDWSIYIRSVAYRYGLNICRH